VSEHQNHIINKRKGPNKKEPVHEECFTQTLENKRKHSCNHVDKTTTSLLHYPLSTLSTYANHQFLFLYLFPSFHSFLFFSSFHISPHTPLLLLTLYSTLFHGPSSSCLSRYIHFPAQLYCHFMHTNFLYSNIFSGLIYSQSYTYN